jgi:SAM-dependent methyltransferase
LPAASFDVVIAAEVIEHLENPRAVVREMFRLLRPGGRALLSTPNNESFRSRVALLVRGHFVAFGDTSYPAHITALVRKDLTRILAEAGFGRPRFASRKLAVCPGDRRGPGSHSSGVARGVRFSDNVLVTAEKPRSP